MMKLTEPRFDSYSLPSVRGSVIKRALSSVGIEWDLACHITATGGHAGQLNEDGCKAAHIATVLDLLVIAPNIALSEFPSADNVTKESYRLHADRWRCELEGFRMRQAIEFKQALRDFRRGVRGFDKECEVLLKSSGDFFSSVQLFAWSGIKPTADQIEPSSEFDQLALNAWQSIESKVTSLAWPRRLWTTWNEGGIIDPSIVNEIKRTMGIIFGQRDRWVIVYHGFYFFTPQQWALFQLLRLTGFIDQVFIVHDDQECQVFESWRRYFTTKWKMPEPTALESDESPTQSALALKAALAGETVAGDDSTSLFIKEYRSPAEFVREAAYEKSNERFTLYAADRRAVSSYCGRLSTLQEQGEANLAQLPIGAFLLRVHECIEDSLGTYRFTLNPQAILDIVSSGRLKSTTTDPNAPSFEAAVRRMLPYFEGCHLLDDWIERAKQLETVIKKSVKESNYNGIDDIDRLTACPTNLLRLAPWADVTITQASAFCQTLESLDQTLRELAPRETIQFSDYLSLLRERMGDLLKDLPTKERIAIESKVNGFSLDLEGDIDVTALIDVVSILLGRVPVFDEVIANEHHEIVKSLIDLVQLAYKRSEGSIHLSNLSEGAFPSMIPATGWPFYREQLAGVDPIVKEILVARSEYAHIGDLYLLWLALDGVEEGCKVTLSWISELMGEDRNPSAAISLLALPRERTPQSILDRIGGIEVMLATTESDVMPNDDCPIADGVVLQEADVTVALAKLPKECFASAMACPRRFAIQWALGPSHSFEPKHMTSRLYGNLKKSGYCGEAGADVYDELWPHLTRAEKESSVKHARVGPGKAKKEWMLTLKGKKDGNEPLDKAYRAALGDLKVGKENLSADGQFLPNTPPDRAIVCQECPVQRRCKIRKLKDD